MESLTDRNKRIVVRFNKEFIEAGSMNSFNELVGSDVVNHAAPPGTPAGPDSMSFFLNNILRKGFPDMHVEIHHQLAEGDYVTTRKTIHATHTGEFLGIAPSNQRVAINVIDIVRLRDGRYSEHWGMSNMAEIVSKLKADKP